MATTATPSTAIKVFQVIIMHQRCSSASAVTLINCGPRGKCSQPAAMRTDRCDDVWGLIAGTQY